MAVDPAGADFAHQVHAHDVAAEREESAVPKREDAGVAPDQVERKREEGKADVLAEERHQIVRQVQGRSGRQTVQERDRDQEDQRHDRKRQPAAGREEAGARHLRPPRPAP